MSDSMDEEFDRGGVTLARGVVEKPQPFASAPGSTSGTDPFAQATLWVRKRGRTSLGTSGNADGEISKLHWGTNGILSGASGESIVSGGAPVAATLGRESPDSDMSSGSDVSINRGIKRMRLEHQHPSQRQLGHQQQHQHQQTGANYAFDSYASADERPIAGWRVQNSPEDNHVPGLLPSHERRSDGFVNVPHQPSSTVPGGAILGPPGDPRERLSAPDRAISDGGLFASSGLALPSRSVSSSTLLEGVNQSQQHSSGLSGVTREGDMGGEGHSCLTRSASSNTCVPFSPYAPRPPAQARYVKGIRVEVNAPSDVDYSNVNNALRQLHMERRMGSTRLRSAGGSAESTSGEGGIGVLHGTINDNHRQWSQSYAWRDR